MTIDIEKLRELAEKATPGPWTSDRDRVEKTHTVYLSHDPRYGRCGNEVAQYVADVDASFIASANPAVVLELLDRLREAEKSKDGAYNERDRCVALIARMAKALGYRVGLEEHPREDAAWDHDWRTIVFVDLPAGQCSWHIHDSERPLFVALDAYGGEWDGHSTEEKYRRVDLTPLINECAGKERELAQEWQRRAMAAEWALQKQRELLDDEVHESDDAEDLLGELECIVRDALAEIKP